MADIYGSLKMNDDTVVLLAPPDQLKKVRIKVRDAIEELAKHPSYGNALNIQKYKHELNATAEQIRRNTIRIAYNFEDGLLESVV